MGEHRAARTRERYPWARYRWLDSLLGLPSHRQRLFLAHRLATSPLCNALGAVVFLGTPFYVKTWQRHGGAAAAAAAAHHRRLCGAHVRGHVGLRAAVAPGGAGHGRQAFKLWRSTAFYSGNIYHAPGFDWSHAMSALVIHAGILDEASLALSTEPIARAYIVPQLASMRKTPFWKPLPRRPTTNKCSDWTLYISSTARIFLWNIIFILPATAVALLSHVLAPLVISMVRKAVVTVSFGLSPKELSFASVFVDDCLHLGSPSHHVQHWNVQKLVALAKTRSLRGQVMAGYEDGTCDMGKVVFGKGLLEKGLPQEGVTGKGVAAEGLLGKGKADERKEQEEARGRAAACMQPSPVIRERGSQVPTWGWGRPWNHVVPGQQHMVAAAGVEGGQGRAPGSVRRSLSLTGQALRQGGEGGEGGEEMGEEEGESKEGRAGREGSPAEGRAAGRGGVGEASVELKTTEVQHGSGRQQRVSARGSREERVAYEFLWNEGALEAAASECETYKLLRPQLQTITHNPRLSDQECVRQVKQLCVMIEERFVELTVQFDLNHGAYFRSPRIIRAMVHFLEPWKLPDWSSPGRSTLMSRGLKKGSGLGDLGTGVQVDSICDSLRNFKLP
ncbi:unnamed protein product [Closterium sp. Yama58-4]|nr:unnamed protein product [Closterium sp. Yama58-4]